MNAIEWISSKNAISASEVLIVNVYESAIPQ